MLEPYVGFKVAIRRNEVQVQDELTRRDHMLEACHEEMKCKFKMSHLEEIICLNLAIHMVIMDM